MWPQVSHSTPWRLNREKTHALASVISVDTPPKAIKAIRPEAPLIIQFTGEDNRKGATEAHAAKPSEITKNLPGW